MAVYTTLSIPLRQLESGSFRGGGSETTPRASTGVAMGMNGRNE